MKSREESEPGSYRGSYVPNASGALRALGRGWMPAISRDPVQLDGPLTESTKRHLYGSEYIRDLGALMRADKAMSHENAMRRTLGPGVEITSDKPGYHHEAVVANEAPETDTAVSDIGEAPATPTPETDVPETFIPVVTQGARPVYAAVQRPGGVPHQQ